MIVAALFGSASTIAGNLIGSGYEDQVKIAAKKIIIMAYVVGIALELIMLISPFWVMRIYTDNLSLIEMTIPAYYVSLTSYITLAPGFILLGIISGTGNTKQAMYMELLALAAYVVNVWFVVIYLKADIAICWSCEHSYNIILTFLTIKYLKKSDWCCKIV
jgi:Na+-driven multidrug efflux pump